MKTIILSSLIFLSFTTRFFGQTVETVYIRVQEPTKVAGSGWDGKMYIIRPDNSTETIDLKRVGPDGNELLTNGIVVKTEVEKWLKKGFKIISFNNYGQEILHSEIFLRKE